MARLIVKSPYIKCRGRSVGAQGYLKYIGTREHVELVPDGRPPTKKQEQLAARLLKDYPDSAGLPEYEDYEKQKTKVSASAFISRALEQHWDSAQHSEVYLRYIGTRPRAERKGSHGLFGDEERVDMAAVMAELEAYEGNVWTHIAPPGVILSVTRLMHHMAEVFRDSVPADATSHGLHIDRKRLRELTRQKGQKAAMNYAREEQESTGPSMSMTAPW